MTHGMEEESSSNGYDEKDGTKLNAYSLTNDCDIIPKDWDQSLMACIPGPRKQRMLRSVTRSQHSKKTNVDDALIDSDNENALIIDIDCDSSTEESKTTKESEDDAKSEKKYTLRPKIQNNDLDWKSDDNVLNFSEKLPSGKDELIKSKEKWLQMPKLKKRSKAKKPLKRLIRSAKPVDTYSTVSDIVKTSDDDYGDDEDDEKYFSDSSGHNYRCPICQQQFTDAHSFTVHIREHNTDKTSHVCMICSKQLCSASSLDRHMFVHSGERPFPCKICKFRFTTNGNMNRHMKTHKLLRAKENRKSAKVVKKLFDEKVKNVNVDENSDLGEIEEASENSIDSHQLLSKGCLSCRVCGKTFLSPSSLQQHMKLHTNDPIKCQFCDLMFENYAIYSKHSCSPTPVGL